MISSRWPAVQIHVLRQGGKVPAVIILVSIIEQSRASVISRRAVPPSHAERSKWPQPGLKGADPGPIPEANSRDGTRWTILVLPDSGDGWRDHGATAMGRRTVDGRSHASSPKGLGLLGRSFGKFVCTSGGGLRARHVSTLRDMTWDGLSKTLESQDSRGRHLRVMGDG